MSQCADICNSRLGLVCNLLWITAYMRMEAANNRGMEAVFNVCWIPFLFCVLGSKSIGMIWRGGTGACDTL